MNKIVFLFLFMFSCYEISLSSELKQPTIVIAILIRNKAHTLPYFLSLIENINYPKSRISLWLRSDHNIDKSIEILNLWLENVYEQYHSVNTKFSEDKRFDDETGFAHWSTSRFKHVMSMREEALNYARNVWANYILMIDADAFLIDPDVLNSLISKDLTVVSPVLKSVGLYSNFWAAMSSDYYYNRSDDYEPILYRQKEGCFIVPMVHSSVLINLMKEESDHLTYDPGKVPNYDGPVDDIIVFALSANKSGVSLNVCNNKVFGFIMVPLEQDDDLEYDYLQLTNLKLEVLVENEPLRVNQLFEPYISLPKKDKMTFDEVYMINLLRRDDRRKRMFACFDELGLDVNTLSAVDGKQLNDSVLQHITFLKGYYDPYHKRPMTFGEIGCFLSHYNIWNEVVMHEYRTILVLEDDVRFEPFFRAKVERLMDELDNLGEWDLVYFGRKRLQEKEEPWVEGSKMLVKVGYSYWTLGYALSLSGARKLLAAEPLSRLLPVDEYLPILFDRHPVSEWKEQFPKRDLIAFSVAPLLLYPTHYTGEKGYISDTEDSSTVNVPSIPARSDL